MTNATNSKYTKNIEISRVIRKNKMKTKIRLSSQIASSKWQ